VFLRKAMRLLVFSLPVLIVTFTVLMAAYAGCSSAGDIAGARIMYRVGMGVLCVLAIHLILLVGTLGALAIGEDDQSLG